MKAQEQNSKRSSNAPRHSYVIVFPQISRSASITSALALMAKGSQLSQLKSALSSAGITGQPQTNGKKRKRIASREHDKDKKTAKLNEIHQRLNPFDTKITKLKHDVGGRKLKGIVGKPAQSKQAGIEQVRSRLTLSEEMAVLIIQWNLAQKNFVKRI